MFCLTATVEIGKKKLAHELFRGLQFLLTASGGGDPGITGKYTIYINIREEIMYNVSLPSLEE